MLAYLHVFGRDKSIFLFFLDLFLLNVPQIFNSKVIPIVCLTFYTNTTLKGYVRKAVALYYLRRFDEAETVYKHLMEIDPSLSGHSVGRQQSALGTAVSKAIPDGTWGQLVAPFSSEAPHGIVSEAFVTSHGPQSSSEGLEIDFFLQRCSCV
jgi:hypothetical protein